MYFYHFHFFFDEVSNFRNRILTDQKQETVNGTVCPFLLWWRETMLKRWKVSKYFVTSYLVSKILKGCKNLFLLLCMPYKIKNIDAQLKYEVKISLLELAHFHDILNAFGLGFKVFTKKLIKYTFHWFIICGI